MITFFLIYIPVALLVGSIFFWIVTSDDRPHGMDELFFCAFIGFIWPLTVVITLALMMRVKFNPFSEDEEEEDEENGLHVEGVDFKPNIMIAYRSGNKVQLGEKTLRSSPNEEYLEIQKATMDINNEFRRMGNAIISLKNIDFIVLTDKSNV